MPELRRKKLKKKGALLMEALAQGVEDLGKLASALYHTSPRDRKARVATSKLRYLMEWRRQRQCRIPNTAQEACERRQ